VTPLLVCCLSGTPTASHGWPPLSWSQSTG